MKILTEIYYPEGMRKKKLKAEGGQVIVRKGAKGRGKADYRATFTRESLIHYQKKALWPLPYPNVLKQKLMLIDGADECITLKYDEGEASQMPVWSREVEEKLFEANVLKAAGSISQKIEVPFMLYIILMVLAMVGFLNLMVATGRLKI